MRILPFLIFLSLLAVPTSPSQDGDPPIAKIGPRAGIVLSPYVGKEIDVTGLAPGSLALDPHTKRAFRIPEAVEAALPRAIIVEETTNSAGGAQVETQVQETPPKNSLGSEEAPSGNGTSASAKKSEEKKPVVEEEELTIPNDLAEFVKTYVESGESNHPEASAAFYAPRVTNYFGQHNLTRSQILTDRVRYLRLYPNRNYEMKGEPRILKADANGALVEANFTYSVGNQVRTRRGSAATLVTVRNFEGAWQITAVEEKKR